MAKKKTEVEEETPATTTPEPSNKPMSKAEAVRKAIGDGIQGNQEIAAYVKDKFGLDVDPKHVSVIKSGVKKKAWESTSPKTRGTSQGQSSDALHAIRAVKEAARQVGGLANLKAIIEEMEG